MHNHHTKKDLLTFEQIKPGLRVRAVKLNNVWSKDIDCTVRSMPWMQYYPEWGLTAITFYAILETGEMTTIAAKYIYLQP